MATTIYHGTAAWSVDRLLSGVAEFPGLFVTESAELAQRYADAQASGMVSGTTRHVAGSAVVEMTTEQAINWHRRNADHSTLDVCEAIIQTWQIAHVTVYATAFNIKASATYRTLQAQLGDRLTIVVVE
jgi:hypothetical protein